MLFRSKSDRHGPKLAPARPRRTLPAPCPPPRPASNLRDVGQVVNLRGGWLPPLSRANAGGTSGSGRLPIGRRLTICPTAVPPHIRYTLIVMVTSTELRKNKLSRLIQRDTINGTLEDLERAQQELDEELRNEACHYSDVACTPSAKGAAALDSAGRKSQPRTNA